MIDKRIITFTDYQRLLALLNTKSTTSVAESSLLYKILEDAKKLDSDQIPGDVITMNTHVRFREVESRREATISITYPRNADNRKGYISVFSSIGVALLGKRVGQVVTWKVPTGHNQFEILEVLFQPEAVGDYSS